jgi:hypothetical protein
MRTQETRRRLRTFIDASIIQLAKWVKTSFVFLTIKHEISLQGGRKLFKKEILPHLQELLPTNWQISDDGTKSIFLLVSLVNLYPVCINVDR